MDQWLFWAVAAALAAVVAAILVQALRRGAETAVEHPDLKVYRDQLAEVDRDLARGTLAADEAQRLRVEVSRRLLEADRAVQKAGGPGARTDRRGLVLAVGFVLIVLAGALWLYNRIGAPGYPDLPLALRLDMAEDAYKTRPSQAEAVAAVPAAPAAPAGAEFAALMDKLRAAVAARPEDVTGLELLARNESALGNFDAALAAQTRLLDVQGDAATADQQLMMAEILIAQAGGYVSPEAEGWIIRTLEQDPQHPMARYLSGLMFAQVGRPDRSFALWQPLLAEGPAEAPWAQAIRTDIQAVAEQAGIRFSLPDAKGPDLQGPSAADMAAASDMSAADRQAMIEGMVGQLEARLMSDGGPVEDWVKLMGVLGVLAQPDRGRAALAAAEQALAADPAALAEVRTAAAAAGFAP
ncbi:c-type cytochrome biogenesis protein CcmI [Tabrizicola oligotrophica]|nr:c-type cytochrome biogenesis protein CcmI [Tabrizicola oligotrophica]